MRPGCGRPASTRLAYDPDLLEAWLDELAAEPGPVQEVCDFHADRLTAPRGWTVSDRRQPKASSESLPSGRPPSTVAATPPTAPQSAQESAAPESTSPESEAPQTEVPESAVPQSAAPEPVAPEVTAPGAPAQTSPASSSPAPTPPAPAASTPKKPSRRRRRSETERAEPEAPAGSLLSRAFEAGGPQHSVLTQGIEDSAIETSVQD